MYTCTTTFCFYILIHLRARVSWLAKRKTQRSKTNYDVHRTNIETRAKCTSILNIAVLSFYHHFLILLSSSKVVFFSLQIQPDSVESSSWSILDGVYFFRWNRCKKGVRLLLVWISFVCCTFFSSDRTVCVCVRFFFFLKCVNVSLFLSVIFFLWCPINSSFNMSKVKKMRKIK